METGRRWLLSSAPNFYSKAATGSACYSGEGFLEPAKVHFVRNGRKEVVTRVMNSSSDHSGDGFFYLVIASLENNKKGRRI